MKKKIKLSKFEWAKKKTKNKNTIRTCKRM